jgi:hypothetical protein
MCSSGLSLASVYLCYRSLRRPPRGAPVGGGQRLSVVEDTGDNPGPVCITIIVIVIVIV